MSGLNLKHCYVCIRHGESKANVAGLIISDNKNGCNGYGLTMLGNEQSIKCGKQLNQFIQSNNFNINNCYIYYSDFMRTKETAHNISDVIFSKYKDNYAFKNKHYNENILLRERYFGNFNNTTSKNYELVWKQDIIDGCSNNSNNIESTEMVVNRLKKFLSFVETNDNILEGSLIILVTHGDVCTLLQSIFEGISHKLHHKQCSPVNNCEIRDLSNIAVKSRNNSVNISSINVTKIENNNHNNSNSNNSNKINSNNNDNIDVKEHLTERQSKYPMLSVKECTKIIMKQIDKNDEKKERETISVNDGFNRILYDDVKAMFNIPEYPTSMMDGYAIKYDNLAVNNVYKVKDIVVPGLKQNVSIKNDEIYYITTGGALPNDTDCVVKIEDTKIMRDKSCVQIVKKPKNKDQYIREPGCDMKKDSIILKKGALIESSDIGILSMNGISTVKVYKNINIGIISTGNELCDANDLYTKTTYEYFDCNRPMLISLCKEIINNNGNIIDGGILNDEIKTIKPKILSLINDKHCKIIISTGGVSMGSRDHIKPILNDIGTIHFGRVSIKPGKPTTFGTITNDNDTDTCYYFGLPGNPCSAYVCFKIFVEPAIKYLIGYNKFNCGGIFGLPPIQCELLTPIKCDPERPIFHPSKIYWDKFKNNNKGSYIGVSSGFNKSSKLLSIHNINCLLRIPQQNGILKQGTIVKGLVVGKLTAEMPPKINSNTEQIVMHTGCACCHPTNNDDNKSNTTTHSSLKHHQPHIQTIINVGILVISDRASKGIYTDKSGPTAHDLLTKYYNNDKTFTIDTIKTTIVPDEALDIKNTIYNYIEHNYHLILTLGGTGFSNRDITPEITKKIIDKECPGIIHLMFMESLKITPYACLARYTAGIKDNSLIINLPGNPKAVSECLNAIKFVLPHALQQLSNK